MFNETTLLDWLVKGFVAVLTFLGIDLHKRVRELEQSSATQKALSEAMADIKDTMKEHREETRQGLSEIRTLLIAKAKGE